MKFLKAIGQLLGFIAWSAVVGWFFYQLGSLNCQRSGLFSIQDFDQEIEVKLPSIIDLQTGLVDAGYDIGSCGIDGRLADCNTVQAWIRYEKEVLTRSQEAEHARKQKTDILNRTPALVEKGDEQ